MEIERKWLVSGWPDTAFNLPLTKEHEMAQGYISTYPTVRLRKEALKGGATEYILCFKSGGGLSREEIEMPLTQELFEDLSQKILGKPLIPKLRRSYALPDGLILEVNEVDKGQPTAFFYAEIEFASEAAARAWCPEQVGQAVLDLSAYLNHEVTYEKGQSMAAYWLATRK
ncbi:MAG: CYTH domain-containing protein [Faecalibacterium sp.]